MGPTVEWVPRDCQKPRSDPLACPVWCATQDGKVRGPSRSQHRMGSRTEGELKDADETEKYGDGCGGGAAARRSQCRRRGAPAAREHRRCLWWREPHRRMDGSEGSTDERYGFNRSIQSFSLVIRKQTHGHVQCICICPCVCHQYLGPLYKEQASHRSLEAIAE